MNCENKCQKCQTKNGFGNCSKQTMCLSVYVCLDMCVCVSVCIIAKDT